MVREYLNFFSPSFESRAVPPVPFLPAPIYRGESRLSRFIGDESGPALGLSESRFHRGSDRDTACLSTNPFKTDARIQPCQQNI